MAEVTISSFLFKRMALLKINYAQYLTDLYANNIFYS